MSLVWDRSYLASPQLGVMCKQRPRGDVNAMQETELRIKIAYRIFQSKVKSWNSLFDKAGAFATKLGKERLINISHSESGANGIVTVWYWEEV